ncbi:GH92 family glycosyl hydrolase [Persicobacter psychrovividus]|uniref:Alpha-1 2-mannosidase n=1 Tax=Persicobacter psychrovividus TaxID=387638 RepID=A0ABM7VIG6_9BACT|nr:alpha-1 2-mannosidase [Persicobacter psychrovividus]
MSLFNPKHLLSACMLLAMGLTSCGEQTTSTTAEVAVVQHHLIQSVNPFIGTSNKGHTYPGATTPWGMVTPTPHTEDFRQPAPTPAVYEHHDPYIFGFGTVNISGIGCPASGAIPLKVSSGDFDIKAEAFKSTYKDQVATPGYYSVFLDKSKIKAEMTATKRTALYRFTPNAEAKTTNLYLDLGANVSHIKGGALTVHDDGVITGYNLDGLFCDTDAEAKTYFAMKIHQQNVGTQVYKDGKPTDKTAVEGSDIGMAYVFDNSAVKSLEVSVGISFVSAENARMNLAQEQNQLSFSEIHERAENEWEKQLAKVEIEGGTDEERTIFYTALYHSILLPHVISDVDGSYPKMGGTGEPMKAEGYTRYSTYSLWDTYRSVHPLMALLYPKQQRDMVVTMVEMYKESGWLPKWELFGAESHVMVGDPAVPVIVDTYRKGITDFDAKTALEAMVKQGTQIKDNPIRPGLANYLNLGYIPIDDRGGDPKKFTFQNGIVWGPVSTTLEYNFADYCVSALAKELGNTAIEERFFKQSQSFKTLYDPSTTFFRPKKKNGEWMSPFDPLDRHYDIRWKGSGGKGYCEGNAWQYNFFVPHAMPALKDLMGEKVFVDKLEQLFAKGQFDITNEPDITFPYLFNYVDGQAKQTQRIVWEEAKTHFVNGPKGIPGNDDAGTLSAWLVFSQLGIFPDAPGIPTYQLTTPKFKKATLHLDEYVYNNQTIVLEKPTAETRYFETVKKADGSLVEGFSISHQDLIKAKHLSFEGEPAVN